MITSYLRKPRLHLLSDQPDQANQASQSPQGSCVDWTDQTDQKKEVLSQPSSGVQHLAGVIPDKPTDDGNCSADVQNIGFDSDVDPDLEEPILQDGTEWADAVGMVSNDGQTGVSTQPEQSLWSTVVGCKANSLANTRKVGDGAKDFVIPDKHLTLPSSSVRGRGLHATGQGGYHLDFSGPEIQHKSVVEPVFLAYNRVSTDGSRISLMQVATAVVDTLGEACTIDAVQPMRSGWWIYLQTTMDRDRLVTQGLNIAGKHMPL